MKEEIRKYWWVIIFLLIIGGMGGYEVGREEGYDYGYNRAYGTYGPQCYVLFPTTEANLFYGSHVSISLGRNACGTLNKNYEYLGFYLSKEGAYVLNQSANWTWGG